MQLRNDNLNVKNWLNWTWQLITIICITIDCHVCIINSQNLLEAYVRFQQTEQDAGFQGTHRFKRSIAFSIIWNCGANYGWETWAQKYKLL